MRDIYRDFISIMSPILSVVFATKKQQKNYENIDCTLKELITLSISDKIYSTEKTFTNSKFSQ